MIKFENTEIAFKSKSDKELKKAHFLFKVMGSPSLVKAGNSLTKIAISINFPVAWAAKPTLYAHFVGGETIEKCKTNVEKLGEYNVKAILDYSVEGKDDDKDIEKALQETINSIKNAGSNPNIPFAVFKPTAFGKSAILEKASENKELTEFEKAEVQKFKDRIDTLCKTAFEADIPILVDAEDTWFQNIFDIVVTEMMEKYNKEKAIVFNTYQMYRWDRLDILKQAHKAATEGAYFLGAKFVRGAYMEKERARAAEKGYKDPIQPDKESTDCDFNLALKYCVENIKNITVFNGTHNEYSSAYLAELMEEKGYEKNDKRFWFSQLYGMSDHISFNLAQAGYNVAKYMPYGPVKHVLPYLLRRAEENTSVKGQSSRELQLIEKEAKRRVEKQY
ncbi:MAG: proline dehydrogenase family protein [Bacteroidales bacterium]|nr:proline dehydrogenase family protein [Bacteroidales bacterium]MBN2755615.1 proline dehydrogenase family protein [Bacteroidales bacterium]